MKGVSIQSPSFRVIEHTLIELGFVPFVTGRFANDWFSPTTGEKCHISMTDAQGVGSESVAVIPIRRVYTVKWL